MNTAAIVDHLSALGYGVELNTLPSGTQLRVSKQLLNETLTLVHMIPDEVLELPTFYLLDAKRHGQLAHILCTQDSSVGFVCAADKEALSINYEVPTLVYEDAVALNFGLIERALRDPEWNRSEMLREFHSHWDFLCEQSRPGQTELFMAANDVVPAKLRIRAPTETEPNPWTAPYFALSIDMESDQRFEAVRKLAGWDRRATAGRGCLLGLKSLEPAPLDVGELKSWFHSALEQVDSASFQLLQARRGGLGRNTG